MKVSRGALWALSIFFVAIDAATAFTPLYYCSRQTATGSCRARYSSTALWLEPLAKEGDWSAYLDQENTGLVYYFNGKTGESLWEPPTNTFPEVMLDKNQKAVATKQRKEYFSEPEKKGGSFFSAVLDRKEQPKETPVEAEEQPNWFDGLFEKKEDQQPEPKQEEEKKSGGFFGGIMGSKNKTDEIQEKKQPVSSSSVNGGEGGPVKDSSFVDSIFGLKGAVGTTTAAPAVQEEKIFTTAPPRKIEIEMSSVVLPHPEKVAWGGEDAVFTTDRSFGVFDGVSGAEKLDGIPLYSVMLADEMKRMLGQGPATMSQISKKLTEAAEYADRAATGASTAVVASIDEKGFLRVLNLGDSACVVIRNNKVVAKTREIVHYFDCPYQLSEDSPDRPNDGTKLNLELLQGDIILMGSDGVFDNLSEQEILETVARAPDKAATVAKRIANLSRKISLNDNAPTPYARQAKRNGFDEFKDGVGGKLDDISCVVVRCT